MVHINCGSAIATLPAANWATPLGKLKTTAFFMLAQSTRVVQHDEARGGGRGERDRPHTEQNETV
jgi:predicted class III extradiol MEMO1 family dioxygenase